MSEPYLFCLSKSGVFALGSKACFLPLGSKACFLYCFFIYLFVGAFGYAQHTWELGLAVHHQVSRCSRVWEARKRASLTADQCRVCKEENSVVASTHELSQLLQMSLLTMLVVIVDELQLDRLSLMRDVRGYLLYRIAGELQELGVLSMDGSSALSAALLAFCAHTAMQKMALYSRLGSALTDMLLIACVNVVTQNASSGAGADAAQQFTRVGVVCILTYKVNALLVS